MRHLVYVALSGFALMALSNAVFAQPRQVICLPGTNANTGNNTCFDVNASNPLPVTGSGGSSTANQGTPNAGGALAWPVVQASQPLPTGAATSALQSQPMSNAGVGTTTALTVQGNPSGLAIPISGTVTSSGTATTTPGQRIIVALDISIVTTGGTAVTALNAGHRTAGGFLLNPIGATVNLCINEQATASGTTSAAGLTCVQPGQTYNLTPASGAVSVITSDSSHPFSGQGLN